MIMMNTIILSFQIWFPFLDLRSLDNSKSLFGKRFDLLSWSLPLTKCFGHRGIGGSVPKTKKDDKNRQCYFSFLKNSLTGPGTFLLPFLPGFGLYLLLDLLHLLLLGLLRALLLLPLHVDVAQPRRLPGPPEFSS